MRKINKRMMTLLLTGVMLVSGAVPVFASSGDNTDLMVKLGDITVDVEKLAEENGVNPYELKKSILNGLNEEKASPFSDLATEKSGCSASESVEKISGRSIELYSTKVSKKDQDSTAYVAKSGALTASGKTPSVGMCAMHTDVTTKTGSTTNSKIKLGTKIYMTKAVKVNGTSYSSFVVEDRGAPSNRTPYWIDIYFGVKNDTNYNAAINYGVKTVSYYYYY